MPTRTELDPQRGFRYVQRAIRKSPAFHRMEKTAEELSEQLEDAIATGRNRMHKTVRQARASAEELVDETGRRVRKHPLRSVGFAAAAGAVLGAVVTATAMVRYRRRWSR